MVAEPVRMTKSLSPTHSVVLVLSTELGEIVFFDLIPSFVVRLHDFRRATLLILCREILAGKPSKILLRSDEEIEI